MKLCVDCRIEKPVEEFYLLRGRPMCRCKACHIVKVAARDAAVGDKHARMQKAHLRRTYDLSQEDYDRLLAEQEGGCAICHRPPVGKNRLSVDHNHETGRVRGLLCNPCNSALGRFNDDPERVLSALVYLQEYALAQ